MQRVKYKGLLKELEGARVETAGRLDSLDQMIRVVKAWDGTQPSVATTSSPAVVQVPRARHRRRYQMTCDAPKGTCRRQGKLFWSAKPKTASGKWSTRFCSDRCRHAFHAARARQATAHAPSGRQRPATLLKGDPLTT